MLTHHPRTIVSFLLLTLISSQLSPSLTSSSPQVHISFMSVTTNLSSNLASTNVQLHFKNSGTREAEATLTFPLPEGVSVSRYWLDVGGVLREAVPVPKVKARQVLEALEQRNVDPGVIEKVEGNSFRTRVYPVPVGGVRKVIIGYDEEVGREGNDYVYKILSDYSKEIEDYSVTLNIISQNKPTVTVDTDQADIHLQPESKTYKYSFNKKNYKPKQTLTIRVPTADRITTLTKKDQESLFFYTVVDVKNLIKNDNPTTELPPNIVLVWDNSLSMRERSTEEEFKLLDHYFGKQSTSVTLYFLNYYFQQAGKFDIKQGDWSSLKSKLQSCTYDGATKYSQVHLSPLSTTLFFTDGLSTLSNSTLSGNRLHFISSTPNSDHSLLTHLSTLHSGRYINLKRISPELAAQQLRSIPVRFQGIEQTSFVNEVFPQKGTVVKEGTFSVVGVALLQDVNLTLRFGTSEQEIGQTLQVRLGDGVETKILPIDKIWAARKISSLEPLYQQNKAEIQSTGRKYSIVTKGTSLIVLESVTDYLKFGIVPPKQLREQYDSLAKNQRSDLQTKKITNWLRVEQSYSDIKKWWDTDHKAEENKKQGKQGEVRQRENTMRMNVQSDGMAAGSSLGGEGGVRNLYRRRSREAEQVLVINPPSIDQAKSIPTPSSAPHPELSESQQSDISPKRSPQAKPIPQKQKAKSPSPQSSKPTSSSTPKSFSSNRPYLQSLTQSPNKYQTYLQLRSLNLHNPTFYLDTFLLLLNNRTLALKVLSSIADLSLENHYLYKTLTYLFKQYESYADCLFTARKVKEWREEEPQSHRDLALALEISGRMEEAAGELVRALNSSFYPEMAQIFDGVQDSVLFDIDRMAEEHGTTLFDGLLDKKYYENRIPVDLRIIMNWNQMDVDMDLHVIDPNNQECYFGHKTTEIGGKYYKDFTRGYGPEQFTLKKAIKGKYIIKTNFFGERKLTDSGPVTVNLQVYKRSENGTIVKNYFTVTAFQAKDKDQIATIEF